MPQKCNFPPHSEKIQLLAKTKNAKKNAKKMKVAFSPPLHNGYWTGTRFLEARKAGGKGISL